MGRLILRRVLRARREPDAEPPKEEPPPKLEMLKSRVFGPGTLYAWNAVGGFQRFQVSAVQVQEEMERVGAAMRQVMRESIRATMTLTLDSVPTITRELEKKKNTTTISGGRKNKAQWKEERKWYKRK